MKCLQIIKIATNKVEKEFDITGKSESYIDKLEMGLVRQLNWDLYRIDSNEANEEIRQAYLDGLAEGRNEQICYNCDWFDLKDSVCVNCNSPSDIRRKSATDVCDGGGCGATRTAFKKRNLKKFMD